VSDLNELYPDFIGYRLYNLVQLVHCARERLRVDRETGIKFDVQAYKDFLQEAVAFLIRTDQELVPQEEVQQGLIDSIDMIGGFVE
jgi:hypothetical protein